MMRILIVDDEAPARERLRALLGDIADQCPHELVGETDNPQDALDSILTTRPDLVLLDVQMPGMTGIELATHIAKLPHPPNVVFVTAYEQYALKAFDVDAVDYLLKPVRATRLAEAIQRADKLMARKNIDKVAALPVARQNFSVMERGRLMLVPVKQVIYMKAEQKYVTLHTEERDYLVEDPLVSIEEEWPDIFVRVHRNALVARNAIIGVERGSQTTEQEGSERVQDSWEVLLRGTTEKLPISRRQWPVVKALLRK